MPHNSCILTPKQCRAPTLGAGTIPGVVAAAVSALMELARDLAWVSPAPHSPWGAQIAALGLCSVNVGQAEEKREEAQSISM